MVVMVEKVVVMNCHVQQKVKVGKTVCDEASVVPWEGKQGWASSWTSQAICFPGGFSGW